MLSFLNRLSVRNRIWAIVALDDIGSTHSMLSLEILLAVDFLKRVQLAG